MTTSCSSPSAANCKDTWSDPGDELAVGSEAVGRGPASRKSLNGPFAESKEFLAEYWIVDVETPEQASSIAARASAAPGPGGGAPFNKPIEVRAGHEVSRSRCRSPPLAKFHTDRALNPAQIAVRDPESC